MPSNKRLSKLKVLITRPERQGLVLANQLQALNIDTQCHPLFNYQASASFSDLQLIHNKIQQPTLIFISVAAVKYAQQLLPISQWSNNLIICVGNATQQALKELGIEAICPVEHHSEGLLNLPELAKVNTKDIVIIKGDGGRELIANTLKEREANVYNLEVYQRVWHPLDISHINAWRKAQINCIVVTSNALLERIVHLVHETISDTDNYWKSQCLWVVASKRIAERAKELSLNNVINAYGASDKHIINTILNNGIAQ